MQKIFSLKGIRGKLLLPLLIVLVPALLIEAFVFYRWFEASKSQELQANLEVARAVARTFDAFVADVVHTELVIGLAATASPPPSKDSLRQILQAAEDVNPMLRSFTWISPEGIHLVATNPKIENRKIASPNWAEFSRPGSGQDWAVSPIFASPYTGEGVFTISRGIRGEQGNLLGVVSATVVADKLDSLLAVPRSKEAGISLIDSRGMRVYRYPAVEYTWEQRNLLERYPMLEDSLKGKDVIASVVSESTGEKRLAAFTPVPSIGWVAAAGRPEDDVVKAITSTLLFQAGLVLLVMLVGFGAAIALARPISSTIIGLRNHALALARGQGENVAPVSGPDELKDLAVVFDRMAADVQSREAALRESEQRWATTLASIGDAVIATDVNARVTFMNPAAEALTGWPHPEAVQKPVAEVFNIINQHTRKAADNPVARVLREGIVAGLANDTVLIRRDGTEVAIDDSGAPIKDGSGKMLGAILVFRDITKRKQAEKAFQEAHERAVWLGRFPEENPNPVLRVSADGMVLYCNPATAKSQGWNCEVGRLLQKELLPLVGRAVAQGKEAQQDVELGGRTYIVWIMPFGEETYVNVYGRDITERKQAEAALRESEARLRRSQEIAKLGSWELDLLNNRLTWSDEVYRIFGLQPQEFEATYEAFLEMVHPDDRAPVDAAYSGSIREGKDAYEIEHRVVKKSTGEIRIVHEKCEHVRDATGRIIRSVGMVHDVTERKQMEEELRKSRDELEMRVKERTAELELRNKELQDFAFVASHDLQEPLRKIQTFGEMLAAKCGAFLDETSRDYIKRMGTAAARMQNLLNSLLSYSRVTTKAEPMKKTDLRESVEEALSDLEIMIREKNAHVEVGDLPAVRADRVQMIQLFQNLIANALKFSQYGQAPHVKVYARQVPDAKGAYEVCVEDNGIGFDEKYLDKIFLPFQRLHGRSGEYEGVGMGLAICRKIVERHGGKITAKSEVGKGSTFIVTLPAKRNMR
jgi:PAS domain S-box-containing protein